MVKMNSRITNTSLVSDRQKINELYGSFDYDSWVMNIIKPERGESVLDLGCGTGKLIRPISQLVGKGMVVGVDKSWESLVVARSLCDGEGLLNVELVGCDIDEVPHRLGNWRFDIIVASYSIYYSVNQVRLMRELTLLLKPHGRLFIVGNDKGNNHELVKIINALSAAFFSSHKPFITPDEIANVSSAYQNSAVYHEGNKVTFPSPAEVVKYWKASSLYKPSLEGEFQDSIAKHFEANKEFVLTKTILGVLFNGN